MDELEVNGPDPAAAAGAHRFEGRRAVIEGMTGTVTGVRFLLHEKERWLFGRGNEADIQLQDAAASRRHPWSPSGWRRRNWTR
jgi:hypothetical protein